MIRLVIIAIVGACIVLAIRKWMGPRLLRVPFIWKSVGRRHPDVAEALRIRKGCGRLLLQAPRPRAEAMMAEIDKVVIEIVNLARTRQVRGVSGAVGDASKSAIEVLEGLYTQLESERAGETEDALDRLRARVNERAADLEASTAGRREIND
jgi:hypothetical protein